MSCYAGSYNRGIVTGGLVLYYDVNEPVCYSSGRTDIQDLSRNGNAGTLVNGVAYSSSNGGSLVFDGVDDYISTSKNFTSTVGLSFSIWFKTSVVNKWILDNSVGSYGPTGWSVSCGSSGGLAFYINSIGVNTLSSVCTSNWINISGCWTPSVSLILYRNSILESINTTTIPSSITNPSYNFQIGRRKLVSPIDFFNGSFSNIQIYTRALSATEIQQNFNATRGRFGI